MHTIFLYPCPGRGGLSRNDDRWARIDRCRLMDCARPTPLITMGGPVTERTKEATTRLTAGILCLDRPDPDLEEAPALLGRNWFLGQVDGTR